MANTPERYQDEEGNWVDPHTVQGEFSRISLSAKGFNPDRVRNENKKRIASQAFHKAIALAGYEDEFENIASLWEQLITLKQQSSKEAVKKMIKNIIQKLLLTRLAPWLFGISLTIYSLQLIFALISLAGIGMWATLTYALEETLVGNAVSFITGFFGGIQSFFPIEYLAMGFWAIAAIISMMGFLGFILFFHLIGVHMMRSTLSSLVLFTSLAISIMPIGNLLPMLFLWVAYVVRSETSVFTMFLEHHSTTHAFNAPLRNVQNMAQKNVAERNNIGKEY